MNLMQRRGSGRLLRMVCLVDAADVSFTTFDVDFVETARALFEAPVGRQRQADELQQERAVDAVVADDHDRIADRY